MIPTRIIQDFDKFLAGCGLEFEAIVIGGGALNVMGILNRTTVDFDVLDPKIPDDILEAAEAFRAEFEKKTGDYLIEGWLNNGPTSLVRDLRKGWRDRITKIFSGKAVTLFTLGRADLLCSKLFAFCDRAERDLGDLIALRPSREELLDCLEWVRDRDANPEWPKHVQARFEKLAKRLGYEL